MDLQVGPHNAHNAHKGDYVKVILLNDKQRESEPEMMNYLTVVFLQAR